MQYPRSPAPAGRGAPAFVPLSLQAELGPDRFADLAVPDTPVGGQRRDEQQASSGASGVLPGRTKLRQPVTSGIRHLYAEGALAGEGEMEFEVPPGYVAVGDRVRGQLGHDVRG